jgi:Xaa-Pro aminopeptidase
MINKRIEQFRELMKKHNLSLYVIPTADDHQSEYISDYYKTRVYMSGFTGSAGTMVITQNDAAVWADGRYHVQAENQLKGTCISLYKMGLDGVPSVMQQVEDWTHAGDVIGFDGTTMSADWGKLLSDIAERKHASVCHELDLVNEVWTDRPALPDGKIWEFDVQYTGKDRIEKLSDVRASMKAKKADVHVLADLTEIAWLFNLRGSDVAHTPVFLAFSIITEDECVLYVDLKKVDNQLKETLKNQKIEVKDYPEFMNDLKNIKNKKVWCDGLKCHHAMMSILGADNQILDEPSCVALAKACKNEVELKNIRLAHEKDGAAFVKFMIWLKQNVDKGNITEISASDTLEKMRREMGAMDLSFNTIAAYNDHGAMMHYSATKQTDVQLKEGLFLVDSGGQYLEGTTDITRTFAIGQISDQWKMYCTTVLKSMLRLARAKFLYGCSGLSLDILARGPIWDMDLDYQCGTGHGIGHLLSVHEGPQAFRWYVSFGRHEDTRLEEGMILTDEPGLYFEGEFGCRLENELVVTKGVKNMYGQFMRFETITYAPIDLDILNTDLLDSVEKEQLNNYHQMVYEKLCPYLNDEEQEALRFYTRAV